jgi:DNA-binding CsgD family transcriptional regulator
MVSHMVALTGEDYRDVLNLVYLANHCEGMERFGNVLSAPLSKMFRAECTTFHVLQRDDSSRVKMAESRSFLFDGDCFKEEDKLYSKLYNDYYYQYSPLLNEALSSSKTVLKTGESISFKDWERSALYNDMIRPQHLYNELFLALRWKNNMRGMITLWRSKKQPDFSDSDVLRCELLTPHLAVALRNTGIISRIYTGQQHLLSSDAFNTEGVLLLDQKLRPFYLNTKAREICQYLLGNMAGDALNLEGEDFPVPSYIIKDCSELLHMVKVTDEPVLWPKERVIITKSGRKFLIECSLVWKANQTHSVPNFMVAIRDLADAVTLETAVRARYSLSKRELEIIYYIIAGMSYNEIADKLCISKLTVHTHVKNIYRKTRAKNRIELDRLFNTDHSNLIQFLRQTAR